MKMKQWIGTSVLLMFSCLGSDNTSSADRAEKRKEIVTEKSHSEIFKQIQSEFLSKKD